MNKEHIKTINKLDEGQRKHAVNLIAAGAGPKEAIAHVTPPPNTTLELVGDLSEVTRDESEMSDEEWLETHRGEVLVRLKYQAAYQRDALLYRETRDARQKFRGATKNALAQSKVQITGPFYNALARVVNIDHPSRWLPCGRCGGTGMHGDKSKCGHCHGHAHVIKATGKSAG